MPPLRARAPLDLDLEDHLVFGLTPVRFGYLAIGALAAYTLARRAPGPLGVPLALLLLATAAALAWVRWHGRPLDAWLLDLAIHAHRNLEVEIDPVLLRRIRAPLRRRPLRIIAVSGAEPGAGASTVALELGAALALKGRQVSLRPETREVDGPRLGINGAGVHEASGLRVTRRPAAAAECVILDLGTRLRAPKADLALVVVRGGCSAAEPPLSRPARHVQVIENRVAQAEPRGPLAIPEDPAVPLAQEQADVVVIRFPGSRAADAFHRLADAVDPSRPGPWQTDGPSAVPPAG